MLGRRPFFARNRRGIRMIRHSCSIQLRSAEGGNPAVPWPRSAMLIVSVDCASKCEADRIFRLK